MPPRVTRMDAACMHRKAGACGRCFAAMYQLAEQRQLRIEELEIALRESVASPPFRAPRSLVTIRQDVGDCSRCTLARGRTTLVFGAGNARADLMFVGEAPGADEDLQGEPFVGKAGQLLTKMIEAIGFRRNEVYLANVVKCRPPDNRDPEPDEIAACEPFLKAQIAAVKPRVLVALGRVAVKTLLRDPTPISRLRGRWREYEGVKLMPTFHPAYLLRNPPEKTKAWEDLRIVRALLGEETKP